MPGEIKDRSSKSKLKLIIYSIISSIAISIAFDFLVFPLFGFYLGYPPYLHFSHYLLYDFSELLPVLFSAAYWLLVVSSLYWVKSHLVRNSFLKALAGCGILAFLISLVGILIIFDVPNFGGIIERMGFPFQYVTYYSIGVMSTGLAPGITNINISNFLLDELFWFILFLVMMLSFRYYPICSSKSIVKPGEETDDHIYVLLKETK